MKSPLMRLAFRELRNNWRFSLFFAVNLAAGLVGLITVESLRSSLETSISARSKLMLSADLSVSARRELSEEEKGTLARSLPPGSRSCRILDVFTMVAAGETSRLVQVRSVEGAYPFYGEVVLEKAGRISSGAAQGLSAQASGAPGLWMDSGLAQELGVRAGDSVQIGGKKFEIRDLVKEDSTHSFSSLTIGPRVYIGRDQVGGTGLIQKGSTATYSVLYQLPPTVEAKALEKKLDEAIPDPGVRIRSHQSATDESARMIQYLGDYLGLVSLSAFLLAALGAVFQFRRFFLAKSREVAILLSLGATHRQAFHVFLAQLLVLGSLASALALGASSLILPTLTLLIERFSPVPLQVVLDARAVAIGLGLGVAGSLLLCLPQLSALSGFTASALFRDEARIGFARNSGARAYLPASLVFGGLSFWLARSWIVGSLFLAGILVTGLLLTGAAALAQNLLPRWTRGAPLVLRMAVRHLSRARAITWLSFVTVGLSAMLVSLVPQIKSTVERDFQEPRGGARPSLFLFDIQEDQVEPLQALIAQAGAEPKQVSPMIRGRLRSVNGQVFEKDLSQAGLRTREAERESAMRNRGFNLTYRSRLSDSEELIEGRDFDGAFQPESGKLPEISVEYRFADRLGWKLGDVLEFDIQGVPVQGRIVNFRKVRWTSFQPNFFVQFQSGVLEDTPKTFLASVPAIERKSKHELMNRLARELPNISAVDVSQVVDRLLGMADQMAAALQLMAAWTALAGLLTLFSIARYEAFSRRWEMSLLKVLGAGAGQVAGVFLVETALISGIAAALGSAASLGMSFALMKLVFDNPWNIDWFLAVSAAGGALLMALALTAIAAFRVWGEKPAVLLSDRT